MEAPAKTGGKSIDVSSVLCQQYKRAIDDRRNSETEGILSPMSTFSTIQADTSTSPPKKRKSSDLSEAEPSAPIKVLPRRPYTTISGQRRRYGQPPPPRPYMLDFSQHKGKTLNELPPSWILWAIDAGIHKRRLDFGIALYEAGRTATLEYDGEILRAEPYSRSSVPELTVDKFSLSDWAVPHKDHTGAYRLWAMKLGAPAWITTQDAINWFQVNPAEMKRAGVCALDSVDMEEIGGLHGEVWWLYVVFKYAEHFRTTKYQTARQMLDHFLVRKKDDGRDGEVMESRVGIQS